MFFFWPSRCHVRARLGRPTACELSELSESADSAVSSMHKISILDLDPFEKRESRPMLAQPGSAAARLLVPMRLSHRPAHVRPRRPNDVPSQ